MKKNNFDLTPSSRNTLSHLLLCYLMNKLHFTICCPQDLRAVSCSLLVKILPGTAAID